MLHPVSSFYLPGPQHLHNSRDLVSMPITPPRVGGARGPLAPVDMSPFKFQALPREEEPRLFSCDLCRCLPSPIRPAR